MNLNYLTIKIEGEIGSGKNLLLQKLCKMLSDSPGILSIKVQHEPPQLTLHVDTDRLSKLKD